MSKEKTDVPGQPETAGYPSFIFFVILRPSVDWMMPTYIMSAYLLYSEFKCYLLPVILSQTYPEIMFYHVLGIP